MTIEEIRHLNGYQFVRLTMTDGTVFEGEAIHDPADYCFHEFGQDEEAVEIDHWLFYLTTSDPWSRRSKATKTSG